MKSKKTVGELFWGSFLYLGILVVVQENLKMVCIEKWIDSMNSTCTPKFMLHVTVDFQRENNSEL